MRVPRNQRDRTYLARAVNCYILLAHTNSGHDFLTASLICLATSFVRNKDTFVCDLLRYSSSCSQFMTLAEPLDLSALLRYSFSGASHISANEWGNWSLPKLRQSVARFFFIFGA